MNIPFDFPGDQMIDQVEDRLCCVYNTGKRQLDTLRSEQAKKISDQQQMKINEQVKKLTDIEDNSQAVETERIRRDISTMQLKFTAEEQEKIRKDKAAKQARIEAYMREMQELKEAKRRADEERRFDMAQRFKNSEVNENFAEKERQERLAKACEMRSFLSKQMEENQRNKQAQKQANITSNTDSVEREDKFFFEYARNLMEDAQQKGRPLYPFVKAVQHYKKDNSIDCERKVPRHMETHISIGRAPQPSIADKKDSDDNTKDNNAGSKTREQILQNCLKINEIIVKAGKEEKSLTEICNAGSDGKSSMRESPQDECASASSVKLRYSIQDLKKLNQFAAPSCH